MNIGRIVSLIATAVIVAVMALAMTSTDKAAREAIKSDPQYQAHRQMLISAGVNPDDPKAVEAYMMKMAEDIKKQQQIPAGAAKE